MSEESIIKSSPMPVANVTASGDAVAVGVVYGDIVNNQLSPEMMAQWQTIFGWAQSQMQQQQTISHAMEWAGLNHEKFCLFVLDNETYKAGAFSIAKSRALKYSPDRERFLPLTEELRAEIRQMPCIFAKRNQTYKCTTPDHPVIYGRITEIIPQAATIKFCFEPFKTAYQQTINENISLYGLLSTTLRNQLDEEHWCIRNGNLQQVLLNLGIRVD